MKVEENGKGDQKNQQQYNHYDLTTHSITRIRVKSVPKQLTIPVLALLGWLYQGPVVHLIFCIVFA